MGISFSLLLIAAGAILAWAVNAEVSGVDIQVVGAILLIVGIVGLVLSKTRLGNDVHLDPVQR